MEKTMVWKLKKFVVLCSLYIRVQSFQLGSPNFPNLHYLIVIHLVCPKHSHWLTRSTYLQEGFSLVDNLQLQSFLVAWHTPSNNLKCPLPIKYLSLTLIRMNWLHEMFRIHCCFTSRSPIYHIFKTHGTDAEKHRFLVFLGDFHVIF
jgi:hypothetical protein